MESLAIRPNHHFLLSPPYVAIRGLQATAAYLSFIFLEMGVLKDDLLIRNEGDMETKVQTKMEVTERCKELTDKNSKASSEGKQRMHQNPKTRNTRETCPHADSSSSSQENQIIDKHPLHALPSSTRKKVTPSSNIPNSSQFWSLQSQPTRISREASLKLNEKQITTKFDIKETKRKSILPADPVYKPKQHAIRNTHHTSLSATKTSKPITTYETLSGSGPQVRLTRSAIFQMKAKQKEQNQQNTRAKQKARLLTNSTKQRTTNRRIPVVESTATDDRQRSKFDNGESRKDKESNPKIKTQTNNGKVRMTRSALLKMKATETAAEQISEKEQERRLLSELGIAPIKIVCIPTKSQDWMNIRLEDDELMHPNDILKEKRKQRNKFILMS